MKLLAGDGIRIPISNNSGIILEPEAGIVAFTHLFITEREPAQDDESTLRAAFDFRGDGGHRIVIAIKSEGIQVLQYQPGGKNVCTEIPLTDALKAFIAAGRKEDDQ